MRAAAEILLAEADALLPLLDGTSIAHFDRPTVCDGWSVRDVLAHCGAAMAHIAAGTLHGFTPADNQRDVEEHRSWPLPDVIAKLAAGYVAAAEAIDAAGGTLDGIGIGEWMHGGDVREALDKPGAYGSAGIEHAVGLLLERSRSVDKRPITAVIDGTKHHFGRTTDPVGRAATDLETFVRLTGGRRPDPTRYVLDRCTPGDLRLFY